MTINRPGRRGCTYSLACPGRLLPARTRCLEHPRDTLEWSYALNGVALGLVRDFSGVTFSAELFEAVRGAAGTSLGAARFEEAVFDGDTDFSGFEFTGATSFSVILRGTPGVHAREESHPVVAVRSAAVSAGGDRAAKRPG
ncbi:hypothetical protein, partial [Streptomyces regalis]|uniref:hypothetical protein n=1 Tax=Streptomyces regalis TaxID=68262 RepID=UPI003CC51BE0